MEIQLFDFLYAVKIYGHWLRFPVGESYQ
jgi:hypothetical protein